MVKLKLFEPEMITVTPIQKRFADVDMLGHVNNVNQQHYFDLGKSDYFTQVINGPTSWTKEGLIAVATNTNYMAQIWYNEPIVVRTRLEKIGNKSLTLFQQIVNTQTEEIKSESRSVLVAFDFVAQRSIPIPPDWREKFAVQL